MEYPRILYRVGTACELESGAYDWAAAKNAEHMAELLADGWHLDQYAAKDAGAEAVSEWIEPEPEAPADHPPTRAELEQKATELGLKFDGRTGDKKLSALIAAAL
jgi:hypothetical protein